VTTVFRLACVLPLAFAACTTVSGQNRQPAKNDGRPVLFRGARVVVGDGRVVEDAAVLVQNGLLFEVGRSADVVAPRGAAVVNVSGKTIVPAIVNAHSHLGWEKYTSWGSSNFTRENLIDPLYRHAYYGVGTVISTASDRESIGLPVAPSAHCCQILSGRPVSLAMPTPPHNAKSGQVIVLPTARSASSFARSA